MVLKVSNQIGGNDFSGGRNLLEGIHDVATDYKCEFEHPREHAQRPEGLTESELNQWRAWVFDNRNPKFFKGEHDGD